MMVKYLPDKLNRLPYMLILSRGHEEQLLMELCFKYGPEPSPNDPTILAATPPTFAPPRSDLVGQEGKKRAVSTTMIEDMNDDNGLPLGYRTCTDLKWILGFDSEQNGSAVNSSSSSSADTHGIRSGSIVAGAPQRWSWLSLDQMPHPIRVRYIPYPSRLHDDAQTLIDEDLFGPSDQLLLSHTEIEKCLLVYPGDTVDTFLRNVTAKFNQIYDINLQPQTVCLKDVTDPTIPASMIEAFDEGYDLYTAARIFYESSTRNTMAALASSSSMTGSRDGAVSDLSLVSAGGRDGKPPLRNCPATGPPTETFMRLRMSPKDHIPRRLVLGRRERFFPHRVKAAAGSGHVSIAKTAMGEACDKVDAMHIPQSALL